MIPLFLLFVFFLWGCGVKMEQLPLINYPYVSEIEFLQEVKNIDGRAKKTTFKHDRITSPFYFLVKIKEVENNGVLTVCFYTTANVKAGESDKKVAEKTFHFGEDGKYYEYIIFFDRVDNLEPGRYRYAVFCNQRLIYEGQLVVSPREGEEVRNGETRKRRNEEERTQNGMFQVRGLEHPL